jgi:hypothetical protein
MLCTHTLRITPIGKNLQENAGRCIFHSIARQGRKNHSSIVSVKDRAGLVKCSWKKLFAFTEKCPWSVNIFNDLNYLPLQLKDIS